MKARRVAQYAAQDEEAPPSLGKLARRAELHRIDPESYP